VDHQRGLVGISKRRGNPQVPDAEAPALDLWNR